VSYECRCFLSLAEKLDLRLLTIDIKLAKKLQQTKYRGLLECPDKQQLFIEKETT
jgi:hypothetical protein